MTDLGGRVALVTGAGRGIGAAIARSLADAGAHVALASRSGDDLGIAGALVRVCRRARSGLAAGDRRCDGRAVRGLDILVVNAGVGAYGSILDLPTTTSRR